MHRLMILASIFLSLCFSRPATTPAAPTLGFSLQVTDASDQPISTITSGQNFWLDLLVQDTRTGLAPADMGVVGAETNVPYSSLDGATATPTGIITPGLDYPVPTMAPHGDTSQPGLLQNVQGTEEINPSPPIFVPLGNGALTLDRVEFTAGSAGTLNFQTQTLATQSNFVIDVAGNTIDSVPIADITAGEASLSITSGTVPEPASLAIWSGVIVLAAVMHRRRSRLRDGAA
jgi:hypothetical protein